MNENQKWYYSDRKTELNFKLHAFDLKIEHNIHISVAWQIQFIENVKIKWNSIFCSLNKVQKEKNKKK